MSDLLPVVAAAGRQAGSSMLAGGASDDPRLWLAGEPALDAILQTQELTVARVPVGLRADLQRRPHAERAAAAAVAQLSLPPEVLLAVGADDRVLPVHGTNSYGMPLCDRDPLLRASSCTATPPDAWALDVAARWQDEQVRGLLSSARLGDVEAMRARVAERLLAVLDLDDVDPDRVVLSPSGTDVPALVTALVARDATRVLVVTVGAREAGSGTSTAAGMRAFRAATPFARGLEVGAELGGADTSRVRLVDVELRDTAGRPRPDRDVERAVESQIGHGLDRGERVIVHVMGSSKTSLRCPGPEWVRTWLGRHPQHLRIVVDAAQARTPRRVLQEFVRAGAAVLVTGSKAMGGPPFCGALLLSETLMADAAARRTALPGGFAASVAAGDLPPLLGHLAVGLEPVNLGLLARWEVALAEAERFLTVARAERRHVVRGLVAGWRAALYALPGVHVPPTPGKGAGIVCFRVHGRDETWLTRPGLSDVYAGVTATPGVYLGPPVELGPGGCAALRLAVGAPTVTRLLEGSGEVAAAVTDVVATSAHCLATALAAADLRR